MTRKRGGAFGGCERNARCGARSNTNRRGQAPTQRPALAAKTALQRQFNKLPLVPARPPKGTMRPLGGCGGPYCPPGRPKGTMRLLGGQRTKGAWGSILPARPPEGHYAPDLFVATREVERRRIGRGDDSLWRRSPRKNRRGPLAAWRTSPPGGQRTKGAWGSIMCPHGDHWSPGCWTRSAGGLRRAPRNHSLPPYPKKPIASRTNP